MIKRGALMCMLVLFSCMTCVSVEAASASPQAEFVIKKVQRLLDQKAGFGNASYVRNVYEELEEIEGDDELHPYAKNMIWRMTDTIEERYAFIKSIEELGETKQVIKNGTLQKRNQVAVFPQKVQVAEKNIEQSTEHAVANKNDTKEDEEIILNLEEFIAPKQIVSVKADKESTKEVEKSYVELTSNENIKVVPFDENQDQWYALGNGRINMSELRRVWIRWVNDFRKEEGVDKQIVHQPLLDKTATEHSYYQRSIGEWTHRRTPHSAFYDYLEINQWFHDRGLDFKNVNRATHTENVGLSTLYCDGGDCTDEAELSLSWVFDYFIKEKGTNYTAHYDTIVQPYFGEMGFGIAIDEDTDTIYSTMHYATEAIRKPVQLTNR